MEALEARTLLSSNLPTGKVETLSLTTISGWAFSTADGAAPLDVIITINGTATTLSADDARPDLVAKYGSPNHGFTFTVPALDTGIYTVTVDAHDPLTGFDKRLKTGTLKVAPPVGKVELISSSTISGWAFSAANNSAAIDVIITIDGNATTITADDARPDLVAKYGSANHGFSFTVPPLTSGTHTVTVQAVDPSTDAHILLKAGSIVIGPPAGKVEIISNSLISGWAYSGANGGEPLDVIITINGHQTILVADDDHVPSKATGNESNHGFNYSLPALPTGANTLTVDIVNGETQALTRIKTGTIVIGQPVGAITELSMSTISGWAFNPASGAAPVNVVITVNGEATTIVADDERPELVAKYGSPYHGFTFDMPDLPPGANTVTIDLVDPYTGQTVRLKTATLTNAPPTAAVDVITDSRIAGWALDAGMSAALKVRIDVNGTPISAPFTANDIHKVTKDGMNVGFDVSGNFAGKVIEIYVYDPADDTAVLAWTNNQKVKGALTSVTGTNISGWAADPDAPSTPVQVRIEIDGILLTTTTANIARPDVEKKAGALNVGFSVDITGLTPGSHTIRAYAIDGQADGAAMVLLGSKVVVNAPPVGNVVVLNTSVVQGYAYDPDTGDAAVTVTVYVDDQFFATTQANLTNATAPGHGFSVSLASLDPGSHAITVTVMDNRTSDEQEVVIFDDFLNNHQPIGEIESVTGTTITGWAQDPDTPIGSIPVDIYVDGQYATTVNANDHRNDLVATLGSADHGWEVDLPALPFGTHRIDAYASESQLNVSSLIGTVTVTNNRPIGAIESLNNTTITGWAQDPDRPTESVTLKVYVNGELVPGWIANKTRNDLVPLIGSANHGFTISPGSLTDGDNKVDIYAVDLNNGLISYLGSIVIHVEP